MGPDSDRVYPHSVGFIPLDHDFGRNNGDGWDGTFSGTFSMAAMAATRATRAIQLLCCRFAKNYVNVCFFMFFRCQKEEIHVQEQHLQSGGPKIGLRKSLYRHVKT
jgi:hypothetical protein